MSRALVPPALLAGPLLVGVLALARATGSAPGRPLVPGASAAPVLEPSGGPLALPPPPPLSSSSGPLPPPSDPRDLLFYVNRWRSIPGDFPLDARSSWTPCLGPLPRGVAPRVDGFVCLPRSYSLRTAEALREVAWDAAAPPLPRTHDGLPVGHRGRVGVKALIDAAQGQGHELRVRSGFRPHASQAAIFRSWVQQQRALGYPEREAERRAEASSAHPGHSEHQLGTTVDLVYREPDGLFYEGWDAERIARSAPMRWVHRNAHRFGLVVSYEREARDVTQYVWEPWHLRFVGVEVADELHRKGLSLEGWLQERHGIKPPAYTFP
ncbi:MAG: M15 family metallopeptidase [Polyangiaceae bacterium]|nr:M15 family metallopeptidase [Polyangiaceae bacterium]